MEKQIRRVIFTCGGTAGHVNPAIAVAQLVAEKNPGVEILFVGAERGRRAYGSPTRWNTSGDGPKRPAWTPFSSVVRPCA